MKKNLLYLAILIALCLVGYFAFRLSNSNEIDPDKDFAIHQPDEVRKIIIKEKTSREVVLEKINGVWYVNNNYEASEARIKAMLDVLQKIQVEYNVADNARKKVIENLALSAVKTSFYNADGEEIKSIYIGHGGSNAHGTYMILEHNKQIAHNPYIVNVPGFEGALTYRFTADSIAWRNTQIFSTPFDKISKVRVEYFEDPRGSFEMNVNEELVQINPIHDSLINKNEIDEQKVTSFLAEFENKHLEYYVFNDTNQAKVLAKPPYCKITCVDYDQRTTEATLYRMPLNDRTLVQQDVNQKPIEYDLERYYATFGKRKDFVSVQYYVFGVLLKKYNNFFKSKPNSSKN
ncbi:MAG: DUF4340 domain-containing protein [Bacteroidetes bacterium]|nr:DUF4340 domain-containing protein [Bacteroidota bacterium]